MEQRPTPLIFSKVIGVDISPHMKPDDTPENFWPEVRDRRSHAMTEGPVSGSCQVAWRFAMRRMTRLESFQAQPYNVAIVLILSMQYISRSGPRVDVNSRGPHFFLIHQCYPRLATDMMSSYRGQFSTQVVASMLGKTLKKHYARRSSGDHWLTLAAAA